MAKILTGVQSTGTPHLGNLLGAIIPSIQMANKSNEESYFFIANLHSLTQIKDPEVLQKNQFAENIRNLTIYRNLLNKFSDFSPAAHKKSL